MGKEKKASNIKINTFYNLMKTMSTIIFPLITFPYVSRVLHAENIGKINFGTSIVNYFSLLATLGVTTYAVRECSRVRNDKKRLGETVSQIMTINLCTMLFSFSLMAICLVCVPSLRNYRMLIVIQSMSILFTVIGTDWLNTAMEDFRYITIRTFCFQGIAVVLMLLFVKEPEHYLRYAFITVLSTSGAYLLNILYRQKYCQVRIARRINLKRHFPPIMLLFTMLLSQTLLNSMDVTMLGIIKGDYVVGLYSTAMRISNTVSQVVSSIAWVVMPQLSQAFAENNYKRINMLLHDAVAFTGIVGIPCFAGLNILAPEFIEILGGREYLGATNCLRILACSMMISFISGIFGNMILLPSMREKQFMVACICGALTNLGINFLLIPRFGINGASVATVISNVVITIIVAINIDKEINFNGIEKVLCAPLVGGVGIVIIGMLGKMFINNLWIKTIVVVLGSVIFYGASLVVLKNEVAVNFVCSLKKKIGFMRK